MSFAYRSRDGLFELDPGESTTWRLPPMTPGLIIVSSFYAMPPDWSAGAATGEERSAPVSGGGFRGRAHEVRGADVGEGQLAGGGTARDQPIRQPGDHPFDDLEVGGEAGSYGPTQELTLDLLRGGQVVATDPNHVAHETPVAGDVWTLRVSRRQDGSSDRRRYRVRVQYPSTLPVETRRVPLSFFRRGFHENWNMNPYLDWARLEDNVLSYQWNEQFADLYLDRDRDRNEHVPLGVEFAKLPEIRFTTPTLSAGGDTDPNPIAPIPGEDRPERVFWKLRIEGEYAGTRDVEFDLAVATPNVTLPDPLWLEIRFFLGSAGGGAIGYTPRVESPLLDMLDISVTYPTLSGGSETVNIKEEVKTRIEEALYQLQLRPDGNGFDHYLRPWIVGRYEVEDVTYDRSSDEMVVTYVGRRARADSPVLGDGWVATDGGAPAADLPRLFDTPDELPTAAVVREPRPLRHVDPGPLSRIENIVVLMQENRSFDQVLGYLSRDGMLPRDRVLPGGDDGDREAPQSHVEGLLPGENERDKVTYPEGSTQHYRSRRTRTTRWPSFDLPNPCHSHACVERQVSDNMQGFVADYARRTQRPDELQLVMDYLTDAELPVYGLLAREFAICDHWFCSHIGGTLPNRFITMTGDLSQDVYGSPEVENPDLIGGFAPLESTTFLDHLTERGVSWKVFEHGYSFARMMRNFTFDETNVVGYNHRERGFAACARSGTLPSVSFIEPDYIELPDGNDDHAPADMLRGQQLVASILGELISSPQWPRTLFIITYDEHGGFYDHVPLPFEIESHAADGTTSRRPIAPLATGERRLGVRVPAFAISPLIEPMTNGKVNVSHTVYDHTSIPATILRTFCSPRVPSMGARTDDAADLRDLITREEPRPSSDFERLAQELREMSGRHVQPLNGEIPAAPLRMPVEGQLEEDWHGLVAFASSITGVGPR